jgi:hypothetical protein
MPIIQHHSHSTIISDCDRDPASHPEAADTTSSQILLSRAIADPALSAAPTRQRSRTPVTITTVYESQARHIMMLGAAAQTARDVGLDGEEWVSGIGGRGFSVLFVGGIGMDGVMDGFADVLAL